MRDKRSIRELGLACVAGGAAFSLVSLAEIVRPSIDFRSGGVLEPGQFRTFMLTMALVVMPGFFLGQLGFFRLGAAGRGGFAKAALALAAVGCACLSGGFLYSAVTLEPDRYLSAIGIPLNQVLVPVLWSVLAWRAREVAPWRRAWPLLITLGTCFMFWVVVPAGLPRFGAPAVVGLLWLVFGLAVVTGIRQPTAPRLAAA